MPKKTRKRSEPGLALALVALITPVLTAGIATSFAEGVSAPAQTLFDQSIFDAKSFLTNRRARHAAPAAEVQMESSSEQSSSSAASVRPCTPDAASEFSPLSAAPLFYQDLTPTQREALRRQLRNHACPQEADAGYKALCERMLKEMPAQETRTGLSNPNQ